MTTEEIDNSTENLEVLSANLSRIEELSRRLVSAMSNRRQVNPGFKGRDKTFFKRPCQPMPVAW